MVHVLKGHYKSSEWLYMYISDTKSHLVVVHVQKGHYIAF